MVTKKTYVPERGDVIWVNFDPTKGHEQRGKRPALVVSSRIYNKASSLVLACPITSIGKKYPFEVEVIIKRKKSYILVDQVRSLDYIERKVQKASIAPASVVTQVQNLLKKLVND